VSLAARYWHASICVRYDLWHIGGDDALTLELLRVVFMIVRFSGGIPPGIDARQT
jgi:hypothetical protein